MNGGIDRLAFAKAAPRIVEHAVRAALADAVAWRMGGGGAPQAETFATAAVAAARRLLDARDVDARLRADVLARVGRAARRMAGSALGRRLMRVPAAQFEPVAVRRNGADAVVRARDGSLHAIAVRAGIDALAASRTATAIAARLPAYAPGALAPLTIHVFSLDDGRRFQFERERPVRVANVA